jgi:hypothetical protein
MKVHVGGNVFECGDYASAKRLAGWFRETLAARFACARCHRTTAIPLSQIERLPPDCRVLTPVIAPRSRLTGGISLMPDQAGHRRDGHATDAGRDGWKWLSDEDT